MASNKSLNPTWKDAVFRQREELARMLREPLSQLSRKIIPYHGDCDQMNMVLQQGCSSIPYCSHLYVTDNDGVQLSDNITHAGITTGYCKNNHSQNPYMKEAMPPWGFLLSDAYTSLITHRPSLTALQVIVSDAGAQLGYLGAEFDLRSLPVTSALYPESKNWRQVKGDPSIRGALFRQTRKDSMMDQNIDNVVAILEELITGCGVFQCQIHFSSSQITIWTVNDPLSYRILDQEILMDTDICLLFPSCMYPVEAVIPSYEIINVLTEMRSLRMIDQNIYLRNASINIVNGMISLTFSCDGTHYMRYDEFLSKGISFWTGLAA